MVDTFEKTPVKIFDQVKDGAKYVAGEIAALIRKKQAENKPCVLGLATGSTPKSTYAELVRLHKEEGLSFENVITFNLDEYYPIEPTARQSYYYFMHQHLFNHVNIRKENIHIPSGTVEKSDIKQLCTDYEAKIEALGGIQLQILGIGINGHIGFNEPGSSYYSKTRLVHLENSTRIANAYEFSSMSQVPRLAVTMGIQTILKAERIILMAWGDKKSPVVKEAVEGLVDEHIPASLLQNHSNTEFVLDQFAAADLTRNKSPWLAGDVEWTPPMIRKAVVSLAQKVSKPILSLTEKDYRENGLSDLLTEEGDYYQTNLQVFYMMRDSITGWPGGKPNVLLPNPPERSEPYPKTSLIFSPHPDDDIISMGGTFQRLHDQGHHVHVAYQTSGNIAVTDEFVTRFMDFVVGFEQMFAIDSTISENLLNEARAYLKEKKTNEIDSPEIRAVKGLVRRCEAKATCRYVGIDDDNIHFMNLPFYETGTIEKKPMGEADIEQTVALLRKIKPHQVFAAGDLADPHGTHKVCLDIIFEALRRIKADGDEWINNCWLWLYKGAWQEWDISEIEMAIPMSPDQVLKKRHGIFIHQSQKDSVPFQGSDSREFWQRAEDRNANTANLYAQLGLTKYAAMEAFVRWHY